MSKRKRKQVAEQVASQPVNEPVSQPEPNTIAPPEPEPLPEPNPEPPSIASEPEPIAVQERPAEATPTQAPLAEDELPPPPEEVAESAKGFPPIKTRKPGAGAALRRAGAVFGKDAGTIAKHGLVSSVILLVFLMLIFYIASYAMFTFVTTGFGQGGDGGDGKDGSGGPVLGNDGTLVAIAGADRTINAGDTLSLDSSATEHSAPIMYVQWTIENTNSSWWGDSPSVYGPMAQYRFYEAGTFKVEMMVVDAKWNGASDNFTVTVDRSTSDTEPPVPVVTGSDPSNVPYGTPIFFDATNSTDNVGVVNWTWRIQDVVEKNKYGPKLSYVFDGRTNNNGVTLVIRDAAGNTATTGQSVNIVPTDPSDGMPNARISNLPESARIGDTVTLDASQSLDDKGISDYIWFVQLNNTRTRLTGQTASFVAKGFGMYEITLVVRDHAGNAATSETGMLSLAKGMEEPSMVSWTSTPLGQDIPFNVLTFAYGASLLASVIYLGGLFAKGFAHEIQRGTAKTLFFAPLSVTNMVFAKLLYPLIIGPAFMFPLLMISLMPLQQDPIQVLEIGIVSYVFTALVLVSGAYGSCLIYAATKRMSVKPTAVSRSFMYLSLVGTLSVFAGLSYLLDQWFATDTWNQMYLDIGPKIAMFSPFHQGGLLLQNLLYGAPLSLDWIVFVIPAVLIVGGILASRRLYGDIFSRE